MSREQSTRAIPEAAPAYQPAADGGANMGAAVARRAYARKWREAGYTFREIGLAMGVTGTRISQIVARSREE